MTGNSGSSTSVWMTVPMPSATPLDADARVDVCVIGAGIAGLTTAYSLLREGKSVLVLDRGEIGGGETSRTTAHLTNVIDNRFHEIEKLHGADAARLHVESHVAAINRIEQIATLERINCQFERLDGFLFNPPDADFEELEREYDSARELGLSDTGWAAKAPFPAFDTGRCLRFPNQATFHPLLFVEGLARAVMEMGGRVCTNSPVDDFTKGEPVRVPVGAHTVTADCLVVATNAPALNFLEVQTKQTAMRTYAIAMPIKRDSFVNALMWDTADPYHYVRRFRATGREYDLAIVGGEDHKTGHDEAPEHRYDALERWTRERIPVLRGAEHRWSGQVLEPIDAMAFIGRGGGGAGDNVFCATGDSGQGMTHGMIAGILLTDLILGRDNPWAEIYSPARRTLGAIGEFVAEHASNVTRYADFLTGGDVESAEAILPGDGAILRRGRHKIAAYRDPNGTLFEFSAVCTHLGCVVKWNSSEHSWDCPCHGSRFDPTGHVLNGPAVNDLRPAAATASVVDEGDRAKRASTAAPAAGDSPSYSPAKGTRPPRKPRRPAY